MKIYLSIPLVLFLIMLTNYSAISQSKFEFGIALNINHSNINEDIRTTIGAADGVFKGTRLPGIATRIGYKINNKFHLNSGPGISWLGALLKDNTARTTATTFEIPLQLEYNISSSLQFSSGPIYNYITAVTNETDQTKMDGLEAINSRHQLGLKTSIAYSHKLIELSLSYTPYFSKLYELNITDANGNDVGSVVSKFQNIQLGIVFRG